MTPQAKPGCLSRVAWFWRMPRPGTSEQARQAQAEDDTTRHVIARELSKHSIKMVHAERGELREIAQQVDLVISIGGDGTFLEASHELTSTPLLGVNSAPSYSLGHYCLANSTNFADVFESIITGTLKPQALFRLSLTLDGEKLSRPVLNEVLVCDECPAAMSTYHVSVNGQDELHHSSGILIGTSSGSTGTMRSAGGTVLPITSLQWQYLTREMFLRPGEKQTLAGGLLQPGDTISLLSRMDDGKIYIDGRYLSYSFPSGSSLEIARGPDLISFVDTKAHDAYIA